MNLSKTFGQSSKIDNHKAASDKDTNNTVVDHNRGPTKSIKQKPNKPAANPTPQQRQAAALRQNLYRRKLAQRLAKNPRPDPDSPKQ